MNNHHYQATINCAYSFSLSNYQVMHFGRCWARWILRHGGVASVNSDTYLDAAEAFVRDFLAGLVDEGWEQRPAGAFQGVVVALDASGRFVQQVREFPAHAYSWVELLLCSNHLALVNKQQSCSTFIGLRMFSAASEGHAAAAHPAAQQW